MIDQTNNISIKELQELIASPVDYSASKEKCQDHFYYLKGTSVLFPRLQSHEYSGALTLAAHYGRRGELADEALSFIER